MLLWRAGWLLVGLGLVAIGFTAFPLQLAEPTWQLGLISVVLSSGPILLAGAVFVCLATALDSSRLSVFRLAVTLRTAAAWVSLLLFLLIPFQFSSALSLVQRRHTAAVAELRLFRRTIDRIQSTQSETELRNVLGGLPNPPALPVRFEDPFPVIRQRLLENLSRRFNDAETGIGATRNAATRAALFDCSRNGVSLALLGAAFAAVSLSDPRQRTVLSSLLRWIRSWRGGLLKQRSRKDLSQVIAPGWVDPDQR